MSTLTTKTAGTSANQWRRGASASRETVKAEAGQKVATGDPSGANSTAPTPAA